MPWDPMLLKVILKPRKVMNTCQKSGPYDEKNHQDNEIWKKSKIAVTSSIFEIQGLSFGFRHLFMWFKSYVYQLTFYKLLKENYVKAIDKVNFGVWWEL